MTLFHRDAANPILTPTQTWWESKGVLNPGVVTIRGRIVMIYRAVGADGISRFALGDSADGRHFTRQSLPFYEARIGDWDARLGVEDPRVTAIDSTYLISYCKVSVEPATHPKLSWETAPFQIRSWIARTMDFQHLEEVAPVLAGRTTKDLVVFPQKIDGRYVALVREYPSIQLTTSLNLRDWSVPQKVMGPIVNTWEGERVGAGPPPVLTRYGWLLLYHGNEYLRFPGNQRMYRMGLALLDRQDPRRVLYRHPDPVFEPTESYESEGPVGDVVFGTGLLDDGDKLRLYYGAADGVIGLAHATKEDLFTLLPDYVRNH